MMLRRFLGLLLAFPLLLVSGCKEPDELSGGTTGVALYAFDTATSKVMVWTDLSALYDDAGTPAPGRLISSSLFSKVTNLAWGGLALDSQRGILYLVSETGDIVRVSRFRSQTGSVSSVDVTSFKLASSSRLTNGKFGQTAVDAQGDTLFVSENGDSGTRIWVVTGASSQLQDATVALQALEFSGDTGGTGLAAGGGSVYGFMADGNPVGPDSLTGPRLRKGTAAGFPSSQVILGSSTGLGIRGSLALDTANGYLFSAVHATDAASAEAPIRVFRAGQFGLAYNQAPAYTLGTAADFPDLQVLAHAGNKDWLAALRGQGTVGYATLILWKAPLGGVAPKVKTVDPSGTILRGVALDGNAS